MVEALPEITLPKSLNLFEDSLALQAIDATTYDIEAYTFAWSYIVGNDTVLIGNENMVQVVEPGFYHVKIASSTGCLSESGTFVVDNRPLTQTIIFDSIPDKIVNDSAFRLSASASSGLPVQFKVTEGSMHVLLQGDTLNIISAGTVAIRATQGGNEQYQSADTVYQTFEIKEVSSTEIVEDTLYRFDVEITTTLENIIKAELYREQQDSVYLVKQTDIISDQLTFTELETGKYTVKLIPQVKAFLNTYLGKHLLLSEAFWVSLTQDTTVTIDLIATPEIASEHGVLVSGVFVESLQTNSGRIEITNNTTSSDRPIADSPIYLINTQDERLVVATTTDDEGKFSFANVPSGNYRIKADYQGLEVDNSSMVTIRNQPLEVVLMASDKISLISLTEIEQQVNGIEEGLVPKIKLYPNPIKDLLEVQIPLKMIGSQARIFNTNGQVVFTEVLNATRIKCFLSHLTNGQYQLQISYQEKNYSFKILKE